MELIDLSLYELIDEASQDVLVAGDDISGFFVAAESQPQDVVFRGVHEIAMRRARSDDAVLEIKSRGGQKIGEYMIGRSVRGTIQEAGADGTGTSVYFRSFGNRCQFPGAARIWRRWASGTALTSGEWLQWPTSDHAAWLHVVQNSWFATGHRAARYGSDEIVSLDGARLTTKASFYCMLGEAVNGVGGYFGSNLDALADCLSTNRGEGRLVKVVWRDFRASAAAFGAGSFVYSVLETLDEYSVEVIANPSTDEHQEPR